MATETSIPESVFLKKDEMEKNALKSESFEEKVSELLGNNVTQLETVNTPLETSKPTDESGIFFQALSVPTVIADEHSNAPESCKAEKQTEPEEAIKVEEKAIENEVREKDAPEKVESFDSVAPIKKDQGDSDGVTSSQDAASEDIKETTEHVTTVAEFKEQDLNEAPKELDKVEPEDKSVDVQEASEQCEIGSKDIEEQKSEESTKKIEQDEEIKPSVEMEEKREQNGLLHAITSDAYISTQTESQVETTEHEEKEQDVNVLEKDQDKDDITNAQEVTFETGLQEKNDHNEDKEHEVVKAKESSIEDDSVVGVSTQTTLFKESIKYEEPEDVKAIEKEDQGDNDGVTSLQQAPCVDVGETTNVIDFKEQDLNEKPREFIEVETEDKSLDVQETGEECEKGATENIEEKREESIEKAEKEEKTEEIKPEEEVEGTQNDDGLKEKSDSPLIKEVCEETGTEKDEYEKEVKHSEIATVNKDEEKQDVNVLEKDEGEDEVTSAQDVVFEKDLQEKNYHNEDGESEVVTAEETREKNDGEAKTTIGQHDTKVAYFEAGQGLSATDREIVIEEAQEKSVDAQEETEQYDDGANEEREQKLEVNVDETAPSYPEKEQDKYTEEIKPSVETLEEKDVCISTQIESQEEATKNEENAIQSDGDKVKATESEENNDEKTIEKPESSLVEAVCELRSFEIAESKEGVKPFDSFSTTLNENETPIKEEELEKEEEIKTSEVQGGVDDVTSSQNASIEDIKETTTGQHDTTVAYVEEGQGVSAMPKEILIEEPKDKSVEAEEISLELGQPNEQNVEETPPGLSKTISENPEDEIKKEDKELSYESVEDTIDDTTKEQKYTIEPEPIENHGVQDEVSKEKVTDLDETTEVEPREDIIPSASLETSTEDTLNSEKEKAENEILPIEDLESFSEAHVPELVPKSEESLLKEECFISETEKHLDEEKEIISKEISSYEKTEVQNGGDDVTSSHNASNEDIQETTIGQHVTPVAYVEDEQDVSSTPKEILIEEAEDKSIDVGEKSLELGQPSEQNNEETDPYPGKTISQNPEDEIKKEDKDLSHENVEDTKVDTTKKEKITLEQEPVEEYSGQDEVSKEKVTSLNETIDVEPQEDITPSTLLETSKEGTSNSEKEKAESENLPTEDLETVSEVQIPELVPKSEDLELKEESFISETETHLDEEKEIISKEISSDEKTKVQDSGDDVLSSQNASNEDKQDTTIGQHVTPVAYVEYGQDVSSTPKEIIIEEAEDKSIDVEEKSLELGQPNEPSVEETPACPSKIIDENPENEIEKEDKDLSHESVADTKDDTTKEEKYTLQQEPVEEYSGQDEVSKEKSTSLNETIDVEPQEDITPSETLTEDTPNSEKEKAESENLPIEDHETVSDVHIPELVPKSEEPVLKEESFISETKTQLDDEKDTIAKEISSDEKTEQTREIKQETVKEACEETSSEKTELEEGLKLSDSSKDDDQEKDHEVSISSESKGEDNITSSLNEVSEEKEDLQERNYHNEGDVLKTGECVDDEIEEIKSSIETKENAEHVIATNALSSTPIETGAETIEKEEKNGEKAIEYDEKEIVSREVDLEKKQEDEEEIKIGEHATTEADSEEVQSIGTVTKEVLVKDEDKSVVVAQEETEQYNDGENDEREQKPEENTNEIKPSVETNEEKDVCVAAQTESQEADTKNEQNIIESDDDRKEESDIPFVKEVCEENDLKKTESVEEGQLCSPTQTEYVEKTTESEEKNEENIDNDDGQTEKPEIEAVCEAASSEMVESEEKLEKEYEIKTSEVQGGGDDVISSQNASNEDIKETTIDQHDTNVANVEEGQGVSVLPKEIVIQEAEDKSIDVKEISLEFGKPNEQNVEETPAYPSKTKSENLEDEIKKEDRDLSHENVEDTNDNATKEEKCTSEQEPVEECSGQDEKEKVTDLNETTKVEPQEDITTSNSLEASTEDTLDSETEKAETEILPIEALQTVSDVQTPELVPTSEESVLKEECFVSETETHLNEETGTVTKETSSDEKMEQTTEIKQETVKEEREEINEKGITSFEDGVQEKDQEVDISAESQGEDNTSSSQNEVSEEKEDLQEKNYLDEGNEGDHIKSGEGEEVKSSVETKEYTEHVAQIEPEEETTENEEKDGEKAIENEILSREKEQELEKSEIQGGGDDVISSQNTSNEDIKEIVIGQHATTTAHFEEGVGVYALTKEIVTEEVEDKSIHAQEASEQSENREKDRIEQPEESVNEPVNSYSETIEESIKEEANAGKDLESELEAETQADRTEDRSEIEDGAVLTEKVTKEFEQPKEQNVEEIQACLTETVSEKTEDGQSENITKEERCFTDQITKEIKTSTLENEPVESQNDSQDEVSKENFTDLKETAAVVPQEDATPSSSLETSTEDLESVSEVHIPEVIPRSEECLISATATRVDEENGTVTKETSSDENLETQQPENSYSTTEENVTQPEQVGEIKSLYENSDVKEDVTQETQLNNTDCGETVKDVILTEEIEQVPLEVEKEKEINDFKEQIVEEDPYSPDDRGDKETKEEISPSIEDAATIESQVNLPNIESTREVVADSEDSKVKEKCSVLETAEFTDENNVEEQVTKTDEISSVSEKEQENVTEASTKSDEAKSSDLIIEQKALTKENLEVHGELKPTSEPVTEEDQGTIKTKPQPEQSDITCENITTNHTSESKLERDLAEDAALAPENEIKTGESQNEITKNIILTDEVSEEENSRDAEVTEVKAESQTVESIQAADDLSVLEDSKASEPQVNLPEIESIDTHLNGQESNERCIEEEAQGNVGVDIKDGKSENETVEEVILNEVLPEDEKYKESISTKDIINEEAKLTDELLGTKTSVEDTEDKEKETLDEPQADDSAKTTYDAILSSTERDIEVAEIIPECKEASGILTDNLPEASPETLLPQEPSEDNTLLSQNEDSEVIPSVEKDVIDVQRHEKDLDQETKVGIVDVVSNVERSAIEPPHLDTKEATSEFINQENQIEQKKETDESTVEAVIPVEDVKTSTREIEVGSVDATADKANSKTIEVHEAGKGLLIDDEHLDSTCDQNKPIEEGSEVKQESLEVNAPGALGTAATEDLKISQKYVTDDFIEVSQTHPETQKYEVPVYNVEKQSPNEPHQKEITESKIVTEKTDSTHEQEELNQTIAKSLIPEAANLKANEAENLTGESGVKTDEEGEEQEEDHEDDEKIGSGSDAPVMVEASKDMEVKAPKKSHNILSGVGSKVKHSIAKVKKAITGKSSPPKSPSKA